MNTQENNKLIAEFMGYPSHIDEESREISYIIDSIHCVDYNLDFHTDWNWLMPVHKKCMFTKQFTGDDQLRTLLIDAVIDADIDRLYKAVVEFIKQYNK